MTTANDIISRIEEHCGQKIDNRRFRNHIVWKLQREIDKRKSLEDRIKRVLDGNDTFCPETHKAIRLPGSK